MGLPSFVQELLIPGLIVLFAVLVLGVEFGIITEQEFSSLSSASTTALLAAALVAAYLLGIALRHEGWRLFPKLIPASRSLYERHLNEKWSGDLNALRARWLPEGAHRSGPTTQDEAVALMSTIAAYYRGRLNDGWSARLEYHRSVSRVASNSLVSLTFLLVSTVAVAVNRAVGGGYQVATYYLLATGLVGLVAFSLREVFRHRVNLYVDNLLYTDLAFRLRDARDRI